VAIELTNKISTCGSALNVLLALCLFSGNAVAQSTPFDSIASGEAVYRYYCYQCHGYAGNARTLAGRNLSPPPRDFTSVTPARLPVESIVDTVLKGRPGTAMVSFATVLDEQQVLDVARYIHRSFMSDGKLTAKYHSAENGWTDHERYAAAFPFVEGAIGVDAPWESLTAEQQRGRKLYELACVSCHDQPHSGGNDGPTWELRAVSYPRRHFSHREDNADLISAASPYAVHDVAPDSDGFSELALAGRALYEENCAFCHASDGTGRNWIGSFLEPRPRDFTDPEFRLIHDTAALEQRILVGIPGTSMPAWRDVLGPAEIDAIIAYVREAFASD
jgi:cytochrome c oxidase cbb3-type subunit 3